MMGRTRPSFLAPHLESPPRDIHYMAILPADGRTRMEECRDTSAPHLDLSLDPASIDDVHSCRMRGPGSVRARLNITIELMCPTATQGVAWMCLWANSWWNSRRAELLERRFSATTSACLP
jgi:hypothetical protein